MICKLIKFTIIVIIVLSIFIRIYLSPEINVILSDYVIENDVSFYFGHVNDIHNKYIVKIIFEIENINKEEIKTCFIEPNKEIMKYIEEIRDFNYIYPHSIAPEEVRKESIFLLFSRENINEKKAIQLIENQSFSIYSSYNFLGEEITDQVKKSKLPFLYRLLLGLGKKNLVMENLKKF